MIDELDAIYAIAFALVAGVLIAVLILSGFR